MPGEFLTGNITTAAAAGGAGLLLAVVVSAARRLVAVSRRAGFTLPRTDAPPPGGVLASLVHARRHGEQQLRLQRQRFGLFECMRGDQPPETLAASILRFTMGEAQAQAGVFYLGRPGQRLVLAAHTGLAPGGPPPRELRLGQALVGRVAATRRAVTIKVEEDSGLRLAEPPGALPGGLHVLPLHVGGRVKGVLVLAWRDGEAATAPPFLADSAESMALALDSSYARVRVQRLLEATRNQAVVLARQQRELQATNEELARADRYKSEFLANMSHELRTPLNSMLILSQVLAENHDGNLTDDQVDAAQVINRAGSELLLIINDILDMTRVEAGKLDLHAEELDPRQLVADLEDLFRPVAARQDLQLGVSVEADVPAVVTGDPLRLSQILKNLLNNAIKFTEQGGVTLTVRVARPEERPAAAGRGPWLAYAVTDTGIGMDAATAARVSEPFFQGDGSIARRYGGSGLGLSICNRLAALLGGQLTVQSAPGRGSTFVLAVPPLAAVAPHRGGSAPPAQAGTADGDPLRRWSGCLAGRTVLLADGDMRTVYGLSHVLDRLGAKVCIARTAAEAADLAADPAGEAAAADLLCLEPGLFADRPRQLAELVGGGPRPPRPCLWLGSGPAADAFNEDSVTLAKPLDALRVAETCAALCAAQEQPA